MDSTDLVPTCARPGEWEEGSAKGQWYLPVLPILENVAPTSAPPVLPMNLVNLVPLPLSLEFSEQPPLYWNLE